MEEQIEPGLRSRSRKEPHVFSLLDPEPDSFDITGADAAPKEIGCSCTGS